MRYGTDCGLLNLWKESEWPNKFMIQTLARSRSEKTQVDQKTTCYPYIASFFPLCPF